MHVLVFAQLPVAPVLWCTVLLVERTRPSVGVLGRRSGSVFFQSLRQIFFPVAGSAGRCRSLFPFLFLSCCGLTCFERVTSVNVLCHWWQYPLTLAMSGRGSWARKASLRDRSDCNIRGTHPDLGSASVCQQTFMKRVARNACASNVPCCGQVAQ